MEIPSKSIGGAWLDKALLKEGSTVKIVNEATMVDSNKYTDKDGNPKTQVVAKVQPEGGEAGNMRLNWITVWGLRDAFGKETKEWMGHPLLVKKIRMMVSDKMQDVFFLIPNGFELAENEESKLEIRRIGALDERDEFPHMEEEEPVIE